ncbi:MAG: glycosyltransferase family protein [archaeon]
MRVLFFVTGVGYGDATREHAHIEALLKREPKTKIMIAAYQNSYEYFKGKFPVFKIRGYNIKDVAMKFKVIPFIFNNMVLPFFWISTAISMRKQIKKFNPDLIVSDFEPAGITAAKITGRKCIMVFGYDPKTRKEYSKKNKLSKKCWLEAKYFESLYDRADFVVIPTLFGVKGQSVLYHYVNPVVRKMPSDLPDSKKLMKKWGLRRAPVVVMLGGSDFGLKLARNLQRAAHRFDEDFLVFGSSQQLKSSKNFRHIRFSDSFLDYLKVSKGVITLGGQKMLTEALAFKKPLLVFPVENHVEQLMNAYSIRKVAIVGTNTNQREFERQLRKFLRNLPDLQRRMDKLDIEFDGAGQMAKLLIDLKKNPLGLKAMR